MAKVILTTKVSPTYDDLPEQRYHFPRTYLNAVQQAIGDWAIYYEPRRASEDLSSRGGRQAYFAAARITRLEEDPAKPDHYYAYVEDYLEFSRPVPFREGSRYYESALVREDGKTNKGAFGRAVRQIPDHEYDQIFQSGFATLLQASVSNPLTVEDVQGFREPPAIFDRPIVERIVSRPFRDAAFARSVKQAYDDTCAITGIKIINGGGRTEVQAAHIRPVASHGPDSVRNGLALSGTIHWMFDRGLISIEDDFSILIAKGRVPDTVGRMINSDGRISLPRKPELQPHRQFLEFHRNEVFKG